MVVLHYVKLSLRVWWGISNITTWFTLVWDGASIDEGLPADDVLGWNGVLVLKQGYHLGVSNGAVEGEVVGAGGDGIHCFSIISILTALCNTFHLIALL